MHPHAFLFRVAAVSTIAAAFVVPTRAQDFRLQVGPPAAAAPPPGVTFETKVSKDTVLVVRPLGCADPAGARITATAEGLLEGARRTLTLRLTPLPTPGVHTVAGSWPDGGVWVLSLAGTCAGRTAGAIVRLGPRSAYQRDGVELVDQHPTPDQIDHALRLSARAGGPGVPGR